MHSLYIEVMGERLLWPWVYLDNMHEDYFFLERGRNLWPKTLGWRQKMRMASLPYWIVSWVRAHFWVNQGSQKLKQLRPWETARAGTQAKLLWGSSAQSPAGVAMQDPTLSQIPGLSHVFRTSTTGAWGVSNSTQTWPSHDGHNCGGIREAPSKNFKTGGHPTKGSGDKCCR